MSIIHQSPSLALAWIFGTELIYLKRWKWAISSDCRVPLRILEPFVQPINTRQD